MIPSSHALRCALALKLWSIERKSHVMAFVSDPGLVQAGWSESVKPPLTHAARAAARP